MTKKGKFLGQAALVAVALFGSQAFAAIQLSNTRVIIEAPKESGSITAQNSSDDPFVVQSWIEGGAGEMETPFFVTPPLTRLEGNQDVSLNIRKVGGGLPEDRESYYWLNVMEIPKQDQNATNTLTLAVRTRVKLFYRPANLGSAENIAEKLNWKIKSEGGSCKLEINNDTPFIVNFAKIKFNKKEIENGVGFMSMPFSQNSLEISTCPQTGTVEAEFVNDYGVFRAIPEIQVSKE